MAWEVFSFIGTFAFAISGAIIAMEEEYDLFGVYILGVVTAFGGGALRNLLIGMPSISIMGARIPIPSCDCLHYRSFLCFQII